MNFLVFHVGCSLLKDLKVLCLVCSSPLIDCSLFLVKFVHLQIHYMESLHPSHKKI